MKKKAHKTRRQIQAAKALIAKKRVDDANALVDPLATLQSFHSYVAKDNSRIEIVCKRIKDIPPEILSWIFDLMERNMKQLYKQSSWGWDSTTKQNEMTEPAAWYLIASCEGEHIGFSHFRFDMDNGLEVLYCYELQLEPSARRKGLGRFIMQALESMAFQTLMQKVMLTVFKHNALAIPFFHALGYKLDNTSPPVAENLGYVILSKQNLCRGPVD
ncbi:N-alpha-acetyltransferase 40 isoform X2 [Cephus cinctus]|uniref:N-alpha-acetyltransferase 40 n=1 Tax=Cephus cinctus TaxID=211228 RepID=A0AAJ7FEV3_CEPCN|nr:N-alpha-acetyltransferase 40 isoform X2 [Cephus cinctus]